MGDFVIVSEDGLDSMMLRLKQLSNNISRSVPAAFLSKVAAHATARAKVNAPILTGHLRLRIGATHTREARTQASAVIWSKAVDQATGFDYATFLHEFQIPSRKSPPGRATPLGLGPLTAAQPPTPEGGAGGKYIQRVVNFHMNSYRNLLIAMLRKAAVGGDVKVLGGSLNSN